MPPTVKENEILTARPETAQRPSAADASAKPQPVALEVPVTVNGARTVDGGDKREPFSETTKTVLVFGSGAVIRLTASVAPGQLLFLTNEKTKKEVVCQVVKSKNYRNVSGYVELEFTETVVGFWGMRFPGDRIGSGPQPTAPVATSSSFASGSPAISRPVSPRAEAPAMNATPGVVAAKPVVPVSLKAVEPKLAESKFVAVEVPAAPVSHVEAVIPHRPMASVSPLTSSLSTSFDPTASLNLSAAPPSPVSAAPVEFAAPVVPVAPAMPVAPVSTIPEVAVTPAIVKPMISSESATFDAPRVSEAPASFLEPAKSTTGSLGGSATNLLSLFEAKPSVPVAPPPAPLAVDPEMEELKKQTARLQEQLSSMLFSEKPAKQETVSVQIPHAPAVTVQKELAESAAKILEMSRASEPEPAPVRPMETVRVEPVKVDAPAAKSTLADEELKIPAWLEPLARNAAAPASTQELIEKEKGKGQAEQTKLEETAAPPATNFAEETHLPELPLPSFMEPQPTEDTRSSSRKSSGRGFVLGAVAAGVLVLVGGWWFMQQKPTGAASAPATGAQASVISNPAASAAAQPQGNAVAQANPPEQQANPGTLTNASEESSAGAKVPSAVPAVSTSSIGRNAQPVSNPGGRAATSTAAVPVAEQPKKPALGELHLAAPKVSTSRNAQNAGEPDAGITLTADDQPDSGADLGAGLVGGNKQPSAPLAPLPVGGDVKQAKLISSTPPVYPALAKTQHVSGNVLVDALIDANGKVTTMKVVSGPTLLHQAAMDALKQWKYQPATLDGKPVAMHLTVTLQFRLQ